MNTLRYTLLLAAALPCLPFLFAEGKRIRKSVPKLTEPTDNQGVTGNFSKKANLLVLGESTMAGIGVSSHREGFAGHLAAGLSERLQRKIEWKVLARSGATAASACSMAKKLDLAYAPYLIVVGLGGNDSFRFRSPWQWRRDVRQLVGILQGKFPGQPIVFANMPPTAAFPAFSALVKFFIGSQTELLRRELDELAQQLPNVYFDATKIQLKDWVTTERPISLLFSDGVHPSGLTYQLWADALSAYVVQQRIVNF